MYPYLEIGSISIDLYRTMYVVGVVGMLLICLFSRKKYKANLPRAIVFTLITFVFGVAGAKLMARIYVASISAASSGAYIPGSSVRLFGALMFLPIFMIILSFVSGEKFRKLMDYMTPGIFFILACAKFGCMLAGCCYGIADENGIYNHSLDYLVFPVQLYESLCTFAVVAVLIIIMIKRGKVRYGALYPAGTILYCCARFIWEDYRYYEHIVVKDFFCGLTYWQCWAIIAIIISVIWLIILYTKPEFKECDLEARVHYEGKIKETIDTFNKKIKKRQTAKEKGRQRTANKNKSRKKKKRK